MKKIITAFLMAVLMVFGITGTAHADNVWGSPGGVVKRGYSLNAHAYAYPTVGRLKYLKVTQQFQWGQRVKIHQRFRRDKWITRPHNLGYSHSGWSHGGRVDVYNSVTCPHGQVAVRSIATVSGTTTRGVSGHRTYIGFWAVHSC